MSNAIAVTDKSFATEVEQSDVPVVVDFWAEWCGPCKLIAPVLDELAAEYDGRVKVTKLNVDENPQKSTEFQVRSIPTLLFFKNGEKVDQFIGVASKAELKKRFDSVA
ncbi:MAG: thioredoxin [Gemmatimonadetes bacterium]|nr:thioredoxin [Gemmatimonadota bacterium]